MIKNTFQIIEESVNGMGLLATVLEKNKSYRYLIQNQYKKIKLETCQRKV